MTPQNTKHKKHAHTPYKQITTRKKKRGKVSSKQYYNLRLKCLWYNESKGSQLRGWGNALGCVRRSVLYSTKHIIRSITNVLTIVLEIWVTVFILVINHMDILELDVCTWIASIAPQEARMEHVIGYIYIWNWYVAYGDSGLGWDVEPSLTCSVWFTLFQKKKESELLCSI